MLLDIINTYLLQADDKEAKFSAVEEKDNCDAGGLLQWKETKIHQ